jgi:Ser-tRNA(Ala) deacylase AlaX
MGVPAGEPGVQLLARARGLSSLSVRTHRLELDDQTLREWDAVVLDSGQRGIVLDRSAFYPDIIRTATNLVPAEVKEVRIVDIVGLDQQADGGTHVASTAQVGRISVVKVENKGKGFRRPRIAVGE